MKSVEDIREHARQLVERFGSKDLPDIGGADPGIRLEEYEARLTVARERDRDDRLVQALGWAGLLEEEALEVFTATTDAERYKELIQLAGTALVYAEAIRRR